MTDAHRQDTPLELKAAWPSEETAKGSDQRAGSRAGRAYAPAAILPAGVSPSGVLSEGVLALAAVADMAGLIDPSGTRQGRAARRGRGTRKAGGVIRNPVDVLRCRIVWRLVAALFAMTGEPDLQAGTARRRPRCHVRQVAMYLSHVVLSVPYSTVAAAYGRDRTTVVHACAVVEDRRDDAGYDAFVDRCERCVEAVFAPFGVDYAGL